MGSFRLSKGRLHHHNISILLSLWRRRCGHHLRHFVAGRNLPDKEFRYLRTVIVTAAVYWDFSQSLYPII